MQSGAGVRPGGNSTLLTRGSRISTDAVCDQRAQKKIPGEEKLRHGKKSSSFTSKTAVGFFGIRPQRTNIPIEKRLAKKEKSLGGRGKRTVGEEERFSSRSGLMRARINMDTPWSRGRRNLARKTPLKNPCLKGT